jgi:hypothetical protein
MTNAAVQAWPDEPRAWIRSSADRAIPDRFRATTSLGGYLITIRGVVDQRGPGAIEVTVEQPRSEDGDPVTMNVLRKVTVDRVIHEALAQVSRPVIDASEDTGIQGAFRIEEGGETYLDQLPAPGRGRLTAADRLESVAAIYLHALAEGRPPVQAVAEDLPCSRSTAGRLVGQARKAGLLAETTRGKRGSLSDYKRLARSLREAGGEVHIVAAKDAEGEPQRQQPTRRTVNLGTGEVRTETNGEES